MTISIDQHKTLKHLVASGNNTIFAEADVSGTLNEVTGVTVDTSDNLNMFSGAQKAFIVNGTILKCVDFANTGLTVAALTTPPKRGASISQAGTDAVLVVDFVNSAKTVIYGFTTTDAAFDTSGALTDSGGDMDAANPVPSAVVEASDAPHGYDWTSYAGGDSGGGVLGGGASGSLPAKAYLGTWYRGRAVLSGNPTDPFQWYMSRQLNPFDWAYVANDAQTPIAGQDGDAGKIGDIVRALIPFHDDYMIFGCATSMHYLQGDPASGGEMHSIDDFGGVYGAQSWCFDKRGDLYLVGTDGISRIRKGTIMVENLSQIAIPLLLEDEAVDPLTHRITCGYDKRRDGIVIAITVLADGTNSNYFYAIRSQGFFPESYPDECGAYSLLYYPSNTSADSDLLVGCRDGFVRKFDDAAKDDNTGVGSEAINSYALMPLLDLDVEDDNGQGRVNSTTIETAGGKAGGVSGDTDGVSIDMHVADNPNTLVENIRDGDTPLIAKVITGSGRQLRIRDKIRGKWLGVLLKNNTAAQTWALSKLSVEMKTAGKIKGQ
jgi:hypothetical protein